MPPRDVSMKSGYVARGPRLPRLSAFKAIDFIRKKLPDWRDDPNRSPHESERLLNASLCMFLNAVAGKEFPMARFLHESPEEFQRTVDMIVHPSETLLVDNRSYSIQQPFLAIECKRLPAPSRDREREYVSGGAKRSGGIQRFKLGLHAAKLPMALMVGYIQDGSSADWFVTINAWIDELAASDSGRAGQLWTADDRLSGFSQDASVAMSSCDSTHRREGATTDYIRLHHLWILMNDD